MTDAQFEMAIADFLYGQTDEMPALVNPAPPFTFPIPKPVTEQDSE